MWSNLEENWSHFFWLIGETPDTLTILINRIEAKYINCSSYGPESNLNLKNKVRMIQFSSFKAFIQIQNVYRFIHVFVTMHASFLDFTNHDLVEAISYHAYFGYAI